MGSLLLRSSLENHDEKCGRLQKRLTIYDNVVDTKKDRIEQFFERTSSAFSYDLCAAYKLRI
jgi:hypothetical protein